MKGTAQRRVISHCSFKKLGCFFLNFFFLYLSGRAGRTAGIFCTHYLRKDNIIYFYRWLLSVFQESAYYSMTQLLRLIVEEPNMSQKCKKHSLSVRFLFCFLKKFSAEKVDYVAIFVSLLEGTQYTFGLNRFFTFLHMYYEILLLMMTDEYTELIQFTYFVTFHIYIHKYIYIKMFTIRFLIFLLQRVIK